MSTESPPELPGAGAQQAVIELEYAEPIWIHQGNTRQLRYRHSCLVSYDLEDDAVRLTTRAYSSGFRPTLTFSTEIIALKYVRAWMEKWGALAKREIDGRAMSVLIERARLESLPPSPDFHVPPYKNRRPRKR